MHICCIILVLNLSTYILNLISLFYLHIKWLSISMVIKLTLFQRCSEIVTETFGYIIWRLQWTTKLMDANWNFNRKHYFRLDLRVQEPMYLVKQCVRYNHDSKGEGRIWCSGGVSIPCWPVTLAVRSYTKVGIRNYPSPKPVWKWHSNKEYETSHSAYEPMIICNRKQYHYRYRRNYNIITFNEFHYNPATSTFCK
jgi:hypothetical protein